MIKKGVSGGLLSIASLLNPKDQEEATNNSMVRTSSTIREAAKVGLQSLYANSDEVFEKFKDFDLIKAMKDRKNANLLWVRARSIDADVCNTNGDYFSEEELLKEQDYQGKKMPAYKTFEGVPIYTNHKNDDIEQAKGMVVHAEWDDEEKCVYCVFFIDEDAYPDIARGIRQAYIHDVSMGCFPAGTLVLTEQGYKPIDKVQQDDKLVDAEGNLTSIINRQIKIETEKVYNIKFEGGYSFSCTKEHPILAISKENWSKRINRNKNSKPQRVYNSVNPDFIEAQYLKKGDLLAVKTGGEVKESTLTIEQAKLLGYFAAEGNYLKYKNEIKEIEFTFALDEKETLVYDCINLIKSVFNEDARVYERIPKNTIVVRVYSPEIASWFMHHIGEYSHRKSISNELRFANLEIQKAFICSWIKGDGCMTHASLPSNGISVTTCSIELAKDVTYILTRLGLYHKIYATYEKKTYCFGDALKIYSNSKGFDGRSMSFNIELPSYEASKIASDCNFNCKTAKITQSEKNYTDGYILRKIKSIEEKEFNGLVYNFETESHTYTVSNIGVHNCSVDYGVCSICGNKATTERDYCECLKKYKGKMHPNGKRAFEYNYGLKFIELSCVGDGAFESCEILEIYDQEEILEKAKDTIKTAQALKSSITLASSIHSEIKNKREIESALRQLNTLNNQIIKIAQTAGTLVGGQLLGGAGAQNATVVKILQGLGIDPSSQLNILDLVNLALNFLEVAVLNLFSRKDNIDLGHVAKLTKAMGELQNTLQDMIDDGIETGSQKQGQPMITPQMPQAQAPVQATAPQQQVQTPAPALNTQTALFEPSVGKLVSPFSEQQYVMPLGGGVSANNKNVRFVWASSKEPIVAPEPDLNKFSRLVIAISNLKNACDIETKSIEGNYSKSQKNTILASSGDKKIMNQFAKIAQDYKKQNSVALGIDINIKDNSGNRIVLSTDSGIKGYYKDALTNWSPDLSDSQLSQMENGDGYRVAAELLNEFAKVTKTAEADNKINFLMTLNDNLDTKKHHDLLRPTTEIRQQYHGVFDQTMQEKVDNRRHHDVKNEVLNDLLGEIRTEELVRIVTKLEADAKKGLGKEPLEEMLHPNFGHSAVPGKEVMSNVLKALVKTCNKTKTEPEDVLKKIVLLAQNKNFGGILKLASLGKSARTYSEVLNKFAQADTEEPDMDMPTEAVQDIADEATAGTSEGDIMSAIEIIKDSFEVAVDKLNDFLGKAKPEDKKDEMKEALENPTDTDQEAMKGAVTGLSLAGEELGASPSDLTSTVNSMPTDDMEESVSQARLPDKALARSKNRTTRIASKNLSDTIIGWIADVATQKNISTERIVLAAKLFCSYEKAAQSVLKKSIRKSEVKVTDETAHTTTIYATLDDLGFDVKDASFNSKFRDYAVDLLSQSGYEVDPTTFSLTDILVDENGMVTGKVSTRATKSFIPEGTDVQGADYIDSDRVMSEVQGDEGGLPAVVEQMSPETNENVVMTAAAKSARRLARIQNIIKVAQGLGLPGAPTPGGGTSAPAAAGSAVPGSDLENPDAGMAGGPADLGLSSLTGSSTSEDTSIDSQPEPGTKSPWGTICPQCGSKDVDIANGEGSCNSCNAQLKYKFIVEATPQDDKEPKEQNTESMSSEMPPPPVGGIGAPAAGAELGLAGPTGGAAPGSMGVGGAPPVAANSSRVMVKVAYQTSAEVYAQALSEGFNKITAEKLPIGMVCPACGSRNASKKEKTTLCYNCNTISVSEIKKVDNEPGILEASIVWI
jgi:hypothetical protein